MKCTKCNIELIDGCCPKCGYLMNGNKVSLENRPEKFIDEKNINSDFDKLYRNENSLVPTLFGGFYLAFHKCALSALLINLIEAVSMCLIRYYIGRIPYFGAYAPTIIFILFIVFRMLFGAVSNSIILFWDKIKINCYKKRHSENYQKYLYKYKNTNIFGVLIYLPLYLFIFLYFLTDAFI